MSLKLVCGPSGSGKSHIFLEEIKNRLLKIKEEGARASIILLVPEQYTLEAEKKLLKFLPSKGTMKAEVLSFRRLAFRTFEEIGGLTKRHINSSGKAMLIKKILEDSKDRLTYFDKASNKKGFVSSLSELISEFKRYRLSPQDIKLINSSVEDGELNNKMVEIQYIYEEFERILHEKYIDSDDDLTIMAEGLDETRQFEDAEIWIDEFSGFTPQEFLIIEGLLKKAKRVTISLTLDSLDRAYSAMDVFSGPKETAMKLMDIARENKIAREETVFLSDEKLPRFLESQEMAHLERNIYSYPFSQYEKKTEDIDVFIASSLYSELEETARFIKSLVRDKELRYRDIALITGNMKDYKKLISVVFPQFEIPFFIDDKKAIDSHPLIILILSIMDIFINNWSYESVFRYLKTGMTGISREDIDLLENYVLAHGIRGNLWYKDSPIWHRGMEGSYSSKDDLDEETIERLLDIRDRVTAPLLSFREKTKGGKSVRIIATELYELLEELELPLRLENIIGDLKAKELIGLAEEYGHIWNMVMEVLDQIVEAMGEDTMTLDKFQGILQIGFVENKMGLLPPTIDQVMVGSLDRSRNHDIKALIIVGANDGVFPPSSMDEGILSDDDRIRLNSLGVELAKDTKSKVFEDQFNIYRSLVAAKKYLRLSYPIADNDGGALRPSILILRLKKIFPYLGEDSNVIELEDRDSILRGISSPFETFNRLIFAMNQSRMGPIDPIWAYLFSWFKGEEAWRDRVSMIPNWLDYSNLTERPPKNKIKKLYGSPIYSSVSRLESFSACPFAFFMAYGLSAKERRIFKLTMPDLGSFMHDAIDNFSTSLEDKGLAWRNLDRESCQRETSLIVDELLDSKISWLVENNDRNRYLVARLKRVIERAVWVISLHIKAGDFEPIGYELSFGLGEEDTFPPIEIKLSEEDKLYLVGRIDRVDALEKEGKIYIRIIDYKSGSKKFNLNDILYGLQIQLIGYLSAILESGFDSLEGEVLPGAMLYFKIDDPMILANRDMDLSSLEEEIVKELRMEGLLLKDSELMTKMDRNMDPSSLIIPAGLKKDGDLRKSSSLAELEEFLKLSDYGKKMLKKLGQAILEGELAVRPYRDKNRTACDYCPYLSICQFDSSFKDNKYRNIEKFKADEIWNIIEGGGSFEG